jgi:hypothetical protein
MIPEHTTDGFALANPIADPDYYSVPKLLRRAADHLDELNDVTVRDLWLEWSKYKDPETHEYYEKLWPMITVNWPDRRETMPPRPANYFPMTNPEGDPGHSVAKLLKRVAGRLDELGDDAVVSDLIMHTEPDGEGFSPSANTYYSREEGWVQNFDPQTHELLLEWEREGYADLQSDELGEEQKTAMRDSMNYLSITNPEEDPDRYSVPKLLRRVADRIDELGDNVIVNDLILHIEPTGEGYLPSINVYYYYEKDE